MPFRDSILEISPPFLLGDTGEKLQYSEGLVIDGIGQWMIEGVKASMPGECPAEALGLTGRDMQIDRGPNETDDHYATRLQKAVDSHRVKGSGGELLRQLAAYFSPSVATPIRLVSNSAVWHEINLTTLAITKTAVGTNWNWDAFTSTRWFRGWVILDSTAGPWTPTVWGGGTWGGGTWGSTATVAEVAHIRGIIEKWKPAHVACLNIIVTFAATLFERTDASPPNPSGTSDTASWRLGYNANFWAGT